MTLKDLDFSDENWTPIYEGIRSGKENYTIGFKGIFDGNGKTIYNLTITTTDNTVYKDKSSTDNGVDMTNEDYCIGLFGIVSGGTIKNLTLKEVKITDSTHTTVGALVGLAVDNATIENVTVESGNIEAKEAGGIVGRMIISGTIKNCTNKATVKANASAAGIVSRAYYSEEGKTITISKCTNNGEIKATNGGYTGGIAGLAAAEISDCTNKGAVSGVDSTGIGGIVGDCQYCGFVKDSTNEGTVTGTSGSGIGGIIGYLRYNNIQNGTECYKKVEVVEISGNTNKAMINGGTATGVGGIVGLLYDAAIVTGNTNNATSISGSTMVAGIIGGYQNIITTSPYYDKKGYTETVISGNKSSTALASITGSSKSEIIYNNATNPIKIKIINNEPTTDDVICSVTNDENEITYYTAVADAESKFEDGNSLTLLNCSFSNDVSDDKASIWTVIHENCSQVENSWHVKNTKDFSDGYGTKIEPYIIATKEQFQNITTMYEKYAYYKLSDDYSETELTGWAPVSLHGSFDGNGKKLTDVTACLFDTVGYKLEKEEILLKNFEATLNISALSDYGTGSLIKNVFNSGTTTFENINVHGKVDGFWNLGSFYNYGTANYNGTGASYTSIFKNCKSDATLICTTGNNGGGFVGHGYEGNNNALTLSFDSDCKYTGEFYTTNGSGKKYIAMWSSWGGAEDTITIDTAEYKGTNCDADWNRYSDNNNKKITKVVPTPIETGSTVTIAENVSYIIVSVSAQLTAYDDSGNKIPNLSGITLALGNEKKENVSGSVNVLDEVTSAEIDNSAESYGYGIDNGVMTVSVPGNFNYQSGTVRLTVAQYNTNDEIVAAGTIDLCTISKE